jgi:hypothetical protein
LVRPEFRGLRASDAHGRSAMLDAVFLAVGVFFFVAAVLYALACDRL